MYLENEAVIKDFVPDSESWMWVFPIVFGSIGVGILALSVVGLLKQAAYSKIKQYGTPGVGIYLKHEQWDSSRTLLYNIYFTFKNKNGKTVETQTGFVYSEREKETLISMRSFPIKYSGDRATIMVDKNVLSNSGTKKTHQS
jgi:hypothetical protein